MYMIDSCVFIEFLRGRLPKFRQELATADPALYKMPAIVEAELLFGIEHSRQLRRNQQETERMIAPFETVPFDSACARQYATLRHRLAKDGMLIGYNDMLIAATALAHGATLITKNVGEFSRVAGLRVMDPEA